ncbi:hypothetical protein ACFX1Q_036504 [Malus domestica]
MLEEVIREVLVQGDGNAWLLLHRFPSIYWLNSSYVSFRLPIAAAVVFSPLFPLWLYSFRSRFPRPLIGHQYPSFVIVSRCILVAYPQ